MSIAKPTKPAAVAGPTLADTANPQVFSEKTFDWVNYTPDAVQFMADSNEYVESVAADVDADATAVEAARQQVVALEQSAAESAQGAADSEGQALVYKQAAEAAASTVVTATLIPGVVTGNDCDLSTGNYFEITLDANKTVTFSNLPTEGEWSVLVRATGTHMLTFDGNMEPLGSTTLEPPVNGNSRFWHFMTEDAGATVVVGQSV